MRIVACGVVVLTLFLVPFAAQALPIQAPVAVEDGTTEAQGGLFAGLWQLWVNFQALLGGQADSGPAGDVASEPTLVGTDGISTDLTSASAEESDGDAGPMIDPAG